MIVDITHGRGWTEREIGYAPDVSLDIVRSKRPNVVGDFTMLPFRNECVDLLIFDPPFQVYGFGKKPSFVENYGSFVNIRESTKSLTMAFAECRRVLKPNGSLLLKWGTNHRPLSWIVSLSGMEWRILTERLSLACQPEKPFSHRARVYWVELWKPAK
jgi:SAM-dependent methyltransferase